MAQSHRPSARIPDDAEETEAQRAARAREEEEEQRRQAEAATAHLPRPGEPVRPPMSGADAAPGEETVKMNFPRPVTITLPGFRMVRFDAGVQEVPVSMVDHDYLKDCGVTPV